MGKSPLLPLDKIVDLFYNASLHYIYLIIYLQIDNSLESMGKREAVLNLLNITYGLLDKVSGSFYITACFISICLFVNLKTPRFTGEGGGDYEIYIIS